MDSKEQCLGCKTEIKNILLHLNKTTGACKSFYDVDLLKRQAKEKRLERNKIASSAYKQRQMEKDPEGFKAKQRAATIAYEERQIEKDPESFKAKRRAATYAYKQRQ